MIIAENVFKTALDKVFYQEFDADAIAGYAGATSMAFKLEDATGNAVVSEQFMPIGQFESHLEGEEINRGTVRSGNQKTDTIVNYKNSLPIEVEKIEDAKFGFIEESIKSFSRQARLAQEKNSFNIYADGFSGQLTGDGVAVFSNSHTALSGDTVDNLETGALSAANLETVVQSLIEQKGQNGDLGGHMPAFLLVPPVLFPDATEIADSELQTGTANNNLNYFSKIYPGMQVMMNPYLGAAYNSATNAATSYYVGSKNHTARRVIRKGLSTDFISADISEKDEALYKARFREVASVASYEGLVGSNGTA